jgi:hypothetical protein
VAGDATDPASVAALAAGADAVISAISPRPGTTGKAPSLSDAARALIAGLKQAGVKRLITVGGAGSLEVAPGLMLMDPPDSRRRTARRRKRGATRSPSTAPRPAASTGRTSARRPRSGRASGPAPTGPPSTPSSPTRTARAPFRSTTSPSPSWTNWRTHGTPAAASASRTDRGQPP